MSGSRTGVPTIVALARKICRLVAIYGAGNLQSSTSPEFNLAIIGLVTACQALEALDDFPMQIDRSAPFGPEDIIPS